MSVHVHAYSNFQVHFPLWQVFCASKFPPNPIGFVLYIVSLDSLSRSPIPNHDLNNCYFVLCQGDFQATPLIRRGLWYLQCVSLIV